MIFIFPPEFEIEPIEIYPYNYIDLFAHIKTLHPSYIRKVYKVIQTGNDLELLNTSDPDNIKSVSIEEISDREFKDLSRLELIIIPSGQGTLGKIGLGVGLLTLGLSGVGLLGISATTLALTGGSLIFSSIFKQPKNNKQAPLEKRSVNFSGVENVTGSGVQLPLAFGQVSIGSIVVSASIVPYDA